jgi:hypothetical protein
MEQIPSSDCDLVIVVSDEIVTNPETPQLLYCEIWERLETLGMIRPKPDGIFSETVTWKQLVDVSHRGQVDEDQFVYGKRIQLLLDSQPITHPQRFRQLQGEVLERFQRPADGPEKQWLALLNEVIRYWKALRTRTLWLDDVSLGNWRYLNIKFQHSRNLLIFGMLLAVGEASRQPEKKSHLWLTHRLSFTPLERIYESTESSKREQLLINYALFLEKMSNSKLVENLKSEEFAERESSEYEALMKNGTQFVDCLLEILQTSAENWPMEIRRELLLGP